MKRPVLWFACVLALIPPSSVIGKTATDSLRMAVKARQEGLYVLSNEQIDEFLQADPDNPAADYAHLLRAANFVKLGRLPEAEARLRAMIERYPRSQYRRDASVYLVLVLLEQDRYGEALAAYRVHRDVFGPDADVERQAADRLFAAGVSRYNDGRFSESRRLFGDLVAAFPGGVREGETRYYLGLLDYREDRFAEARGSFEKALEAGLPEKTGLDARLKFGDCLFNLDRRESAEAAYRQVAERSPDSVSGGWALFQLAVLRQRSGDAAGAAAILAELTARTKDPPVRIAALLEEWKIGVLRQEWQKAENSLLAVLKDYPDSPYAEEALLRLGFTSFNKDELDRAADYFTRFLSASSNAEMKAAGAFGLGYTLYRKGDFDGALKAWETILSGSPDHRLAPTILFLLGRKHFERNEYAECGRRLEALVNGFPKSAFVGAAYPILVESYIRRNRLDDAGKAVRAALAAAPGPEVRFLQGKVFYLQGRMKDARSSFESLGDAAPALRAEALYYLGTILLGEGDTAGAKARFLEILTFHAGIAEWSDRAKSALKALSE